MGGNSNLHLKKQWLIRHDRLALLLGPVWRNLTEFFEEVMNCGNQAYTDVLEWTCVVDSGIASLQLQNQIDQLVILAVKKMSSQKMWDGAFDGIKGLSLCCTTLDSCAPYLFWI